MRNIYPGYILLVACPYLFIANHPEFVYVYVNSRYPGMKLIHNKHITHNKESLWASSNKHFIQTAPTLEEFDLHFIKCNVTE